MAKNRYRIDLARDEPTKLRDLIEGLEEDGRRIVSLIWQPTRTVKGDDGTEYEARSGYVVISEPDFK